MFRKFEVENFMCLKHVTFDLAPLTIFIGPNSSGKTAIFQAIKTLCALFGYPLRRGKFGDFTLEYGIGLDDLVWNRDSSHPIVFKVWFSDNESADPDYRIELRRGYQGWSVVRERLRSEGRTIIDTQERHFSFETSEGPKTYGERPWIAPLAYLTDRYKADPLAVSEIKPLQDLRARLGKTRRYRPSAGEISAFISTTAGTRRAALYETDDTGKGLALVLRDLVARDRDTFTKIEKELNQFHKHIEGINCKTDWRGLGFFYKTTRSREDIPARLESDGVLLTTFLLWRFYSAAAKRENLKVCLEEPENAIHFSILKQHYGLLKRFTEGNDSNVQILISTHSRDFLNAVGSRSDVYKMVRVIEYSPANGTVVYNLGHYREIDHLMDEFREQVGDLWWSGRARRGSEY